MPERLPKRIKILDEPSALGSSVGQLSCSAVPQRRIESLDGFWKYRCEAEDDRKSCCNVVFPQSAYRTVVEHLAQDKTRELGGFLLGYETHVGPAQVPTVVIEDAVPAKFTIGTPVRLTFTTESWRDLDEHTDRLRDQGRSLQRVGWYHSHPNIAIFLSHWDLDVCKTFEQRQYPVALVVDPINDRAGFFVAIHKVYRAHSPQGFYELSDVQPEPMISWRNMSTRRSVGAAEAVHEPEAPTASDHQLAEPDMTDLHPASNSSVQRGGKRLPIVISVLALAFGLAGFGLVFKGQRELALQLHETEKEVSSLKAGGPSGTTAEAIDAIAANVADLRARVEKLQGSSQKGAEVSVHVIPSNVNIQPSGVVVFRASVEGSSASEVEWTITPSKGSIKQNGEYRAPVSINQLEKITVKAGLPNSGKFGKAVITLSPPVISESSKVSVHVSPDHAVVAAGGKQSFTAKVMGADGDRVTWSIEGDGSIKDGEYAAPDSVAEEETVTVRATSGKDPTKFGTSTVELKPVPQSVPPN